MIGRFFDWGRAEALLFFAFRPWLVLVGAMMIAGASWPRRYALYALFLLVAGLGEASLLVPMGAADPWPEMLRGWAAGALMAVLFDLFIQTGGRFGKRRGKFAATLVLAFALLIPGTLRPYEAIILEQPRQGVSSNALPVVTVLTSLPIVWGEAGPFEPGAGPAQSWRELQREFTLRPIDYIDSESLRSTRLILLAQPRQLSPQELVALDEWVRGGGRILILADPVLLWPSPLPPGDVRRPISTNMLTPLLSHWGIAVRPGDDVVRIHRLDDRQLRMAGTGTLSSENRNCRQEASFVLDCGIGRGRAIVVADADLLHDSTFVAQGSPSPRRHDRLSDNMLAVADWLDRLHGTARERLAGKVEWAKAGFERKQAVLTASLPIAVTFVLALLAGLWRARNSPTYPQGRHQVSDPELTAKRH
ncbi:MAG TPA: Gldg family protein [Allosphingosinicella sp.]|nr:Gldg family protein [Allosphingosinicella sp.]